jgi:hypothetical protein
MKAILISSNYLHVFSLACLATDQSQTLAGRTGHFTPSIIFDTSMHSNALVKGALHSFHIIRAAWRASLEAIQFAQSPSRGLLICVPEMTSTVEVKTIIRTVFTEFAASSLFLTNIWVSLLLGHGKSEGIAVHFGDTCVSVVPVVELIVVHENLITLPCAFNEASVSFQEQVYQVQLTFVEKAYNIEPLAACRRGSTIFLVKVQASVCLSLFVRVLLVFFSNLCVSNPDCLNASCRFLANIDFCAPAGYCIRMLSCTRSLSRDFKGEYRRCWSCRHVQYPA